MNIANINDTGQPSFNSHLANIQIELLPYTYLSIFSSFFKSHL